jgi:hypothetical protein
MPKSRWESALKVALLLAIFATAGPELIPAIEMATLLELLGALLFLTAFSAALRMTVIDTARKIAGSFRQEWTLDVFRHSGRAADRAGVAVYLLRNSINHLALLVVVGIHVCLLAR